MIDRGFVACTIANRRGGADLDLRKPCKARAENLAVGAAEPAEGCESDQAAGADPEFMDIIVALRPDAPRRARACDSESVLSPG